MLKKLTQLIFLALCLTENTQGDLPLLFENAFVKILYIKGKFPEQTNRSVDLKREEEEFLKKTLALSQDVPHAKMSQIPFVQYLSKALHGQSPTSFALHIVSSAEQLFFQISPAQKNSRTKTTLTIHGAHAAPPAYLLECLKSSAPQHKSNRFRNAVLAGATLSIASFAAASYTEAEETLRKELDVFIDEQWQQGIYNEKENAQAVILFVHGWNPSRNSCGSCNHLCNIRANSYSPRLDCTRRFSSEAQKHDVYQVAEHLKRVVEDRKKTSSTLPLICVGHSNGAATLIATLSQYPELAQSIQGLLLVAPYADIALLEHPQKYVPQWLPYRRPIARRLMSYAICPNHNVNARTPEQWIKEGHFPRSPPTLLVHAEDDIQVPYINFELLSAAFYSYRNVTTTSVKTGGHWIGRCEPHNICKKCHPCIHGLKAWQYCEECSKGPEKPCCTNNNHPNYCSRRNCKAEQMSRSQLDTNLRIFFDTILK